MRLDMNVTDTTATSAHKRPPLWRFAARHSTPPPLHAAPVARARTHTYTWQRSNRKGHRLLEIWRTQKRSPKRTKMLPLPVLQSRAYSPRTAPSLRPPPQLCPTPMRR